MNADVKADLLVVLAVFYVGGAAVASLPLTQIFGTDALLVGMGVVAWPLMLPSVIAVFAALGGLAMVGLLLTLPGGPRRHLT